MGGAIFNFDENRNIASVIGLIFFPPAMNFISYLDNPVLLHKIKCYRKYQLEVKCQSDAFHTTKDRNKRKRTGKI